jgi:hypothetical protein
MWFSKEPHSPFAVYFAIYNGVISGIGVQYVLKMETYNAIMNQLSSQYKVIESGILPSENRYALFRCSNGYIYVHDLKKVMMLEVSYLTQDSYKEITKGRNIRDYLLSYDEVFNAHVEKLIKESKSVSNN